MGLFFCLKILGGLLSDSRSYVLSLLVAIKPFPLDSNDFSLSTLEWSLSTPLVFFTLRLKQRPRASDLALNSPFNGRSSKPDRLLASFIKNVTYLYNPGGKNR